MGILDELNTPRRDPLGSMVGKMSGGDDSPPDKERVMVSLRTESLKLAKQMALAEGFRQGGQWRVMEAAMLYLDSHPEIKDHVMAIALTLQKEDEYWKARRSLSTRQKNLS